MRLRSTLSGSVEAVAPENGRIGVYVCGVTPYTESHIGHAMSLLVYGVLIRYLRWRHPGVEIRYVSNYTDVDDKIIERALELGRDPASLAQQNIDLWEAQQAALGILAPDVRPRVTTEIDAIVAAIGRIIENGHAYAVPGAGVYFRVRSLPGYGKLSHRPLDEMRAGTREEPGHGKEFPLDFALWKAAKPGEPTWPSPWGPGRPGWHIECSAMAQRYLGASFSVHGGGTDLVFPHHENEIAQAEAVTGPGSFARLWMHNGMVLRDGEKMSKSLGNVVSVAEALDRWTPDALRLFVLSKHYRQPTNLTDEAMAAAQRGVDRLQQALAEEPAREGSPPPEAASARARFVEAMDDDLNTAQALAVLFDLARAINRSREVGDHGSAARATLRELASVLGLALPADAHADLSRISGAELSEIASRFDVAAAEADAADVVEALLAQRQAARAERDFALSDAIRDALSEAGIEVQDGPQGARWSVRG
ncbi:MAG: cysteine--tRNA ligase [Chloroflexi bacterium]|nr:cysteine--tRNA ligase [Chloroflexota bacterium]